MDPVDRLEEKGSFFGGVECLHGVDRRQPDACTEAHQGVVELFRGVAAIDLIDRESLFAVYQDGAARGPGIGNGDDDVRRAIQFAEDPVQCMGDRIKIFHFFWVLVNEKLIWFPINRVYPQKVIC